ncbi:LamB/YcsF family protein [Streptomyces sp. NBC_01506]|uniref:LamB/YcsF family protein n=1 Tax=Streptomyces sp. NBC_01506 TaxID=2903887 RepID=UPI00386E2EAF
MTRLTATADGWSQDDDAATIDLNADVGEGFGAWRMGDDDALLDIVSSANVACGFHAGDPPTMRRVTQAAAARGVAVGAHVAYRDLAGFGRRRITMDPEDLADEITYQIGALDAFCRAAGDRLRHIKPHGALYHACAQDSLQARAVVDAVAGYDSGLAVFGQPGSSLLALAHRAGLRTVPEGFADRQYASDGTLLPRDHAAALLTDPSAVVAQAVQIVRSHTVRAADGTNVAAPAETLCIHGDTPGAVELARRVRVGLERRDVLIATPK